MTGKPGASGGAREGAGRPLSTYKGNLYRGDTPIEDLWRWLAEKCGTELAEEAHLYFNEQKRAYEKKRLERKEMEEIGTLAEAVQAKKENKVVLADFAGRRVTINTLLQGANGQWHAEWSHSDYPNSRWDEVTEDQQFIIRGKYGRYR